MQASDQRAFKGMRELARGLIAIAALAAGTAAAKPLQLADYLRWESAGSAQISPDGRTIIYRRTRIDARKDDDDSELWVMSARGDDARMLADGWSAFWPSDGRLAYFTQGEQGPRLIVRSVRGAAAKDAGPERTIDIEGPQPQFVRPSRDGSMLAYLANVPRAGERWQIALPTPPEGSSWKEGPTIVDGWQSRVGVDRYRNSDRHLFVVAANGGKARQLTRGDWSVGAFYSGIAFGTSLQWSADGRQLVFEGYPDAPDDIAAAQISHINAIDIASGRIKRLTRDAGFWSLPRVSPDGSLIAYTGHAASHDAFAPHELRVMSFDGSGDRVLVTDTPDRIYSMEWGGDGKSLYVSMNRHGATELMRVTLDGKAKVVATGEFRFYLTSIASGLAVGTLSTPTRDAEVAAVDLASGRLRWLTHHNTVLDELTLGEVESFWTQSADGTAVQAWLVKPPDFDAKRRYPLILDIHGGPDAMAGYDFDFRYHDFAARGYLVLYSNPRGSTGYGAAFANAIKDGFPGEPDAQDLQAVLQSVFARGIVDRERVYVMGCSGGGALAAWMTARTDYFAASAVMCPVTNWISLAGTSDATTWTYTRFADAFWNNPERWLRHSPLMQAGKINTPTLFAVGANDARTPVTQAAELYTALKARGVPTRLLIFPHEGHGPWRTVPSDLMRLQLYLDEWFRTRGRPGAGETSP